MIVKMRKVILMTLCKNPFLHQEREVNRSHQVKGHILKTHLNLNILKPLTVVLGPLEELRLPLLKDLKHQNNLRQIENLLRHIIVNLTIITEQNLFSFQTQNFQNQKPKVQNVPDTQVLSDQDQDSITNHVKAISLKRTYQAMRKPVTHK